GVAPRLGVFVRDGTCAQPVDEPKQLRGGHRLAPDVDELDLDAALPEEPLGGSGGLRVGRAEDLDDRAGHGRERTAAYHRGTARRGAAHRRWRPMMVWFTVQLEDKPGSLARVAAALGERGV